MYQSIKASHLAAVALCAALVGCASVRPVAYSGVASSAELASNPQKGSAHFPYRYSTSVDWGTYSRIILDPVVIYRDADNQFGKMSEADKAALASYMHDEFAEKLKTRFALVNNVAPGTMRVRLTLTGAATNTPVLSTLTRFDLSGGLYNGVQAVRGREGAFTGSVIYAVEIYDATDDRLLGAFVSKQYPNPYNLAAGMGSLAAAKAGIRKGADALTDQLR